MSAPLQDQLAGVVRMHPMVRRRVVKVERSAHTCHRFRFVTLTCGHSFDRVFAHGAATPKTMRCWRCEAANILDQRAPKEDVR